MRSPHFYIEKIRHPVRLKPSDIRARDRDFRKSWAIVDSVHGEFALGYPSNGRRELVEQTTYTQVVLSENGTNRVKRFMDRELRKVAGNRRVIRERSLC